MNRGMAKLGAVGTATLFATGIVVGCGGNSGTDSNQVTITYWQYTFPSKVTEMKKLIQAFEKQNPDIKVVEQDFPYDQYNQKVTAAMHAGKGPDVLNLYYGWIPQYVKQGYLQPIPQDFMSTEDIKNYYIPMVQTSAVDGKYYALPMAVRTLALFYNKDLFQKAGLDPNKPPTTWDELIQDAKKMTITNSNGQFQQEGFAWDVSGQGYHTFEEILLRQFGATPFSEDGKKVLWDASPNGLAAFQYWTDMETKDKIGSDSFLSAYNTAFEAGKAGMMIDGSFDIAAVKTAAKFNWGVTTIPVLKSGGVQSNFGSFWVNGIAKGVTGKKLEASEKFLKFLISEDTEKDWLQNVGELPAAKSLSNDSSIVSDPIYGPFVKGLQSAHATFFVNETQERQDMIDAVSKINLQHADVKQTFANLVKQEQTIRDQYFNKP